MTLAETIKNHPVIIVALAAIGSYGAGWTSAKAVAETGNQVQVVKGDLDRLQNAEKQWKDCLAARRCPATGPVLLPPGGDISFTTSFIVSTSLSARAVRTENEKWDKYCREVGARALQEMGYKLVDVQNPSAVRGERDGIHLGVQCRSAWSAAVLYGAGAREGGAWLIAAAEVLEAKLKLLEN